VSLQFRGGTVAQVEKDRCCISLAKTLSELKKEGAIKQSDLKVAERMFDLVE
jgi:hypothetical protein